MLHPRNRFIGGMITGMRPLCLVRLNRLSVGGIICLTRRQHNVCTGVEDSEKYRHLRETVESISNVLTFSSRRVPRFPV